MAELITRIPNYIKRVFNYNSHQVLSAQELNAVLNLIVTASDYNSEWLDYLQTAGIPDAVANLNTDQIQAALSAAVNAELATLSAGISNMTSAYLNVPLFTFLDISTQVDSITKFRADMESKSKVGCITYCTTLVGQSTAYPTLQQLQIAQLAGHDVISSGTSPAALTAENAAANATTAKAYADGNSLNAGKDIIIYPSGNVTAGVKEAVGTVFDYAINIAESAANINSDTIDRLSIATVAIDMDHNHATEDVKTILDDAMAKNKWCIITVDSSAVSYNSIVLKAVIDYIVAANTHAQIVTATQALNLVESTINNTIKALQDDFAAETANTQAQFVTAAESLELVEQTLTDAIETVQDNLTDATADTTKYVTPEERVAWNAKAYAFNTLTQSGTTINLEDAEEDPIVKIKLYGKSTQAGTPTVETPIPIVDTVNPKIMACRKNFLKNTATTQTVSGVTFTVNADKSVTVNGTATTTVNFQLATGESIPKGTYIVSSGVSTGSVNTYYTTLKTVTGMSDSVPVYTSPSTFTITENTNWNWVAIVIKNGVTVSNLTLYPMIRLASIPDATYEPYAEQTATISGTFRSVNTLADTINSVTGKITRNIGNIASYNGETITTAYTSSTGALTTGATVNYVLPTPTQENIDPTTLTALRALTTYNPITNISNDKSCNMEVTYRANMQKYIDNKISNLTTAIIALGGTV